MDALTISRSEEHTSELQSHSDLVCRLLLEKKNHAIVIPWRPIAHPQRQPQGCRWAHRAPAWSRRAPRPRGPADGPAGRPTVCRRGRRRGTVRIVQEPQGCPSRLKSRPGPEPREGPSGSPTRLFGLLDDYRRSDRRPLIKQGHGAQRDVHAAVGSTCNVGPWTVDGAPGSVVNEVTAIVVEHRVLHPGAGVPVGAALRPGRDELIRGVLRLDMERSGECRQRRPAGGYDRCRHYFSVLVRDQALRLERDHDQLAVSLRGWRRGR